MGSVVPLGAVDSGALGASAGGSPVSGLLGIEADGFPGVRPVTPPLLLKLPPDIAELEGKG